MGWCICEKEEREEEKAKRNKDKLYWRHLAMSVAEYPQLLSSKHSTKWKAHVYLYYVNSGFLENSPISTTNKAVFESNLT